MNKAKRAARKRRRENESLMLARNLDRREMHGVYSRVVMHNKLAKLGYGMVVDEVWVREYYEKRTVIYDN